VRGNRILLDALIVNRPVIEVDARNLLCPMPVIRCQDAASGHDAGTRIRVLCTDPGALNDIPAWSRINGHEVIETSDEDGRITILIELGQASDRS
jgi:tRNA 2-thiouridine synthesizing protein A